MQRNSFLWRELYSANKEAEVFIVFCSLYKPHLLDIRRTFEITSSPNNCDSLCVQAKRGSCFAFIICPKNIFRQNQETAIQILSKDRQQITQSLLFPLFLHMLVLWTLRGGKRKEGQALSASSFSCEDFNKARNYWNLQEGQFESSCCLETIM